MERWPLDLRMDEKLLFCSQFWPAQYEIRNVASLRERELKILLRSRTFIERSKRASYACRLYANDGIGRAIECIGSPEDIDGDCIRLDAVGSPAKLLLDDEPKELLVPLRHSQTRV